MRPIQWHRKKNWRVPDSLDKVIPIPRSLHPHLQWWLKEENVLTGQPLHANFYRRIKRRVGRSLKRMHCKRILVPSGMQAAYKLPRTQGSFLSLKRVPRPLFGQDSTYSDRQHHSGVIHNQGRRHEVGPTVCPIWRILTWCTRSQVTLKSRHIPGRLKVVADKLSRLGQTIQQSGLSFRRFSKQYVAGGTGLK